MCSKDNGQQDEEPHQLFRLLFAGILIFLILIFIIILLVWIILRPSKPRFILEDTTVYNFNISSAGIPASPIHSTFITLSLSMQVTLSANNPNNKIGIDYQKLDVYASYRGQQISLAAELPTTYQGHNELTVWSPYLYGTDVPISPFLLNTSEQDQKAGDVLVNVRVNGRIKWKVGTWFSARYHIYANCHAHGSKLPVVILLRLTKLQINAGKYGYCGAKLEIATTILQLQCGLQPQYCACCCLYQVSQRLGQCHRSYRSGVEI